MRIRAVAPSDLFQSEHVYSSSLLSIRCRWFRGVFFPLRQIGQAGSHFRQASPRPQRTEPGSSAPFRRTSSPTGSSCLGCPWGCQRGSGTQQRTGWTASTQRPPGAGKGGRSRMRCKSVKYICVHEWISFPVISVCVLSRFSCVQLFAIPWTVAHQAPPSMGFSRQEYWNGLPFPSPGDLPDPGIELASLTSPSLAMGSLPPAPSGKPLLAVLLYLPVSPSYFWS